MFVLAMTSACSHQKPSVIFNQLYCFPDLHLRLISIKSEWSSSPGTVDLLPKIACSTSSSVQIINSYPKSGRLEAAFSKASRSTCV